jgi:hypothetical protein
VTPVFHRRTELTGDGSSVHAAIEDYNHHFELTVTHDGSVVTGVSAEHVRAPWSQCPGAAAELQELVGKPIGVRPASADAKQHCTHLIDLASVAVRFAGTVGHRRYDAWIGDWDQPVGTAVIERDDGLRLEWQVGMNRIHGPDPWTDQPLGGRFTPWVLSTFDAEVAEAALVLRRAAWMAPSRGFDLDSFETLDQTGLGEGVCYATQPQRIRIATRNVGMAREGA